MKTRLPILVVMLCSVAHYAYSQTNTVSDTIRGTAHSVDSFNPLYKGQLGKGLIDIEAGVKSVH